MKLALDTQAALEAEGVHVRVVSMPSQNLFDEQDAAYKEEVLPIIDSNTIKGSNGKQSRRIELMGLKGGVPYRYMLKNFFPKLRSGTCIKVFYENIDQKTK